MVTILNMNKVSCNEISIQTQASDLWDRMGVSWLALVCVFAILFFAYYVNTGDIW